MSNQDLKHFSKSDLLGFAGAVFHGFLPPEGDLTTKLTMSEQFPNIKQIFDVRFMFCKLLFMISKNTIPYIGTEILLLTKNDHNSTQKAPKSIIPQEIKSAGHSPSSGSVKSRFKALFKK